MTIRTRLWGPLAVLLVLTTALPAVAQAADGSTGTTGTTAAVARAHYKLDGTTRDEYTGQPGALSGSAAWAGGDGHTYLHLGATGRLTGPRPALTADESYAVLAWVRVATLPTTSRAVVGGTGARFSPYLLAYNGTSRKVEFRVVNAALNQGWVARSSAPITANTWVHVAGLYDSVTEQTSLYVNGSFQAAVPNVTTPAPPTPLVVGATVWAGQAVAGWPGDVDDVRVLAGLPSAEDVGRIMAER